ncbi:FAD-dependent pyridine nucleotide-disulfide oxidoreductase [Corynebacterium maris DSM 45190]|uniref:FAD-dependent pyridine nucleotide-disulfide oxidoreductase n=1 Tax=Corynebacterium maris DSM 45190 TaxID=1224163 RepID=S5SW93_9CORY|nr:FAD-dependent oxidoreductase [Corynebacterium maris]AGS35357.1 FAD-dependent pyridine nucleotide-disulfide oxidoreductase [Corynebacterium maris DSM 45190]
MSTVILGSGHGGIQTAVSLREGGYTAPITVVTPERETPYQRPPLSKDYMREDFDAVPLPLVDPSFFTEHNVTLLSGESAHWIDPERKMITTTNGVLEYDNAVLATGASPRQLTCPGADARGVHSLKTAADAEHLKRQIKAVNNIVVIGAGFIGMEFAVAALKHGCTVTVLEMAERPMARALTPFMSQWLTERYREHGIAMHLQEGVESIEMDQDGAAVAVHSTTGNRYPADLVVAGIGVIPNTQVAENSGLAIEQGILVDESLRTSAPDVYAIGDGAVFPTPFNDAPLRLESVQNATDQAKHVAKVILEGPSPYRATPWFWSTQGRYRLQMTGIVRTDDEVRVTGDPDKGKFTVLAFRDNVLVAAESLNSPGDQTVVRRLFSADTTVSLETAAGVDFKLRTLVAKATPATS